MLSNRRLLTLSLMGLFGLLLPFVFYRTSIYDTIKGANLTFLTLGLSFDTVDIRYATHQTTPARSQMTTAQYVRHACDRLGLREGLSQETKTHILVDDEHKFLFCYVPKVGCTNWRRVLLVLNGQVKAEDMMNVTGVHSRKVNPVKSLANLKDNQTRYRLDNYYKFMFVREPFERLLSAYRDKLESGRDLGILKKFGPTILKYRNSSKYNGSKYGGTGDKRHPHFREFLNYVKSLGNGHYNEHWQRYNKLCNPCFVNYDFIGRYETINDDADDVLRTLGVHKKIQYPRKMSSYSSTGGGKTAEKLKGYYKTVPPEIIRSTYNAYKLDFLLFNYTVPDSIRSLL